MEAPKVIYLETKDLSNNLYAHSRILPDKDAENIKYIRADLAELSWETIEEIYSIGQDIIEEERNGCAYDTEDDDVFYKEISRRFNSKREDRK